MDHGNRAERDEAGIEEEGGHERPILLHRMNRDEENIETHREVALDGNCDEVEAKETEEGHAEEREEVVEPNEQIVQHG